MNDKEREHLKMITDMHHDLLVVMQAALIEWKHGEGAEAALRWIVNTLDGPACFRAPMSLTAKRRRRTSARTKRTRCRLVFAGALRISAGWAKGSAPMSTTKRPRPQA